MSPEPYLKEVSTRNHTYIWTWAVRKDSGTPPGTRKGNACTHRVKEALKGPLAPLVPPDEAFVYCCGKGSTGTSRKPRIIERVGESMTVVSR